MTHTVNYKIPLCKKQSKKRNNLVQTLLDKLEYTCIISLMVLGFSMELKYNIIVLVCSSKVKHRGPHTHVPNRTRCGGNVAFCPLTVFTDCVLMFVSVMLFAASSSIIYSYKRTTRAAVIWWTYVKRANQSNILSTYNHPTHPYLLPIPPPKHNPCDLVYLHIDVSSWPELPWFTLFCCTFQF